MPYQSQASKLYDIAEDQFGFLTTAQAAEVGMSANHLAYHVRAGNLRRVSRGVYRLVTFPSSSLDQYRAATLWPQGREAILSHETALDLFGLSDVNPAKIHFTLPNSYRIRHRHVPSLYVVHHADLPASDVSSFEGLPITTPARTIRDCHATHLGPALIRQAIEDGRRTGYLAPAEADRLMVELLP